MTPSRQGLHPTHCQDSGGGRWRGRQLSFIDKSSGELSEVISKLSTSSHDFLRLHRVDAINLTKREQHIMGLFSTRS